MANVMGLDLSLTASGVVVLSPEAKVLHTRVVSTPFNDVERLDAITRQIADLAERYDVNLAAIEGYAFGAKASMRESIGELGGCVKLALHRAGVSIVSIAPTVVKKFATGKGTSPKEDLKLAVYKRWGLEFQTTHETDAFLLAMLGWLIPENGPRVSGAAETRNLVAYEKEALAKIPRPRRGGASEPIISSCGGAVSGR